MNDQFTLLVLAAGSSTRYGSLKQIDSFGPRNLTIAEYNLLEAIPFGIHQIVFIVKEQTADIFHKRLSKILPASCKFSLIYQPMEPELSKFCNRTKPWGTGHAVLSAKHFIRNNFIVMNADDLYGADAIKASLNSLNALDEDGCTFSAVGYHLANTLSEYGPVSRGLMETFGDKLLRISEHIGIEKKEKNIVDREGNFLEADTLTSMNLWGFTPQIFKILNQEWQKFKKNIQNPTSDEFYLPHAINNAISENICNVKVMQTSSKWHGITYYEDRKSLENRLGK